MMSSVMMRRVVSRAVVSRNAAAAARAAPARMFGGAATKKAAEPAQPSKPLRPLQTTYLHPESVSHEMVREWAAKQPQPFPTEYSKQRELFLQAQVDGAYGRKVELDLSEAEAAVKSVDVPEKALNPSKAAELEQLSKDLERKLADLVAGKLTVDQQKLLFAEMTSTAERLDAENKALEADAAKAAPAEDPFSPKDAVVTDDRTLFDLPLYGQGVRTRNRGYPGPPIGADQGLVMEDPTQQDPRINPDLPYTIDDSEGIYVLHFHKGPYAGQELVLASVSSTIEWVVPSPPPLHMFEESPIIKEHPEEWAHIEHEH